MYLYYNWDINIMMMFKGYKW